MTPPINNLLQTDKIIIIIIRNLKPEWWGSPLVQEEKYHEKPVKTE
jgi:hypothetical protein